MAIDISKDTATIVSAKNVAAVVEQARLLMKLEIEIARLETALKEKKTAHNLLATETLPGLMDSAGIEGLPLRHGYELELKKVLRASLPAKSTIENADEEEQPMLIRRFKDGLAWLRKHKAQDIIRNTLKIDLGKGQDRETREILALAKRLKVPVDRSETVHPASLSSFLRERLANGAEVPFETFGVFNGREAKIKPPKKGKES
jgi:hypothetical protein